MTNAKTRTSSIVVTVSLVAVMGSAAIATRSCLLRRLQPAAAAEGGFVSLFNGRDLAGWKIPAGDNGHWRVVDGAIDYDAESEASGEKHLWTERAFGDFVLKIEWRLKSTPYVNPSVPIIRFDGTQ